MDDNERMKFDRNIAKSSNFLFNFSSTFAIPKYFDSREQWPHCLSIRRISDQSSCGTFNIVFFLLRTNLKWNKEISNAIGIGNRTVEFMFSFMFSLRARHRFDFPHLDRSNLSLKTQARIHLWLNLTGHLIFVINLISVALAKLEVLIETKRSLDFEHLESNYGNMTEIFSIENYFKVHVGLSQQLERFLIEFALPHKVAYKFQFPLWIYWVVAKIVAEGELF